MCPWLLLHQILVDDHAVTMPDGMARSFGTDRASDTLRASDRRQNAARHGEKRTQ